MATSMKIMSACPEGFGKLESLATAAGLNWQALLAWGFKYGESLFLPVVLDLIAGNWIAAIGLAAAQGAGCLSGLLAALGIGIPAV